MKAIIQNEVGDVNTLYIGDITNPILKNNEVLVKVYAFGVNRADILQRKGKYPSPAGASPLMGLEIAGVIEENNGIAKWKKGDAVLGLIPGGGYASYVAIDSEMLWAKPERLTFEQAAAIPEAFMTAYLALSQQAQLKENERVLIHAASGGVGTAAIQLAKAMKATVIITASASKHNVCKDLGADVCIDYKSDNWCEVIQKTIGKNSINVVIDFIGASYFNDNISILAIDGRMVMLALMGGADIDAVDLRKIIGKRITVLGSTLRNRDIAFQRQLAHNFEQDFLHLFSTDELKPVIDTTMDWSLIKEAHQRMESNQHIGKIIMTI